MIKGKHPYIIAEIGGNHNGDIALAKEMIKKAKECGADAVKFQLYRREDLWTEDHLKELNDGSVKLENVSNWSTRELGLENIFEQVDRFSVQEKEHIEMFNYAREIGIDYSSSAFINQDIDFLIKQKVSFLKIASCDVTNLQLIKYAIEKDYPIVISLGLASLGEIEAIVNLIPNKYKKNVTLLHCISLYPPKDKDVNLSFIKTLKTSFGLNVGYSDHTFGYSIPLAACAIGASVIEKHFTLDKNMPGWDHKVSANPEELCIICEESKRIINSLGNGIKTLTNQELDKRKKFRRSITSSSFMRKGHVISEKDILLKRPGTGISADKIDFVIGRMLKNDIDSDKTIFWEDLA